ncbi:MAG: TIGR02206 family membrane protein [Saprospiraceae bacterium]|nr:TIGR02206 family membrane protein [Saprospiraceae bacterium]
MAQFEAYTWQHVAPLLVFAGVGWWAIRAGRRSAPARSTRIGLILALVTWLPMLIGSVLYLVNGEYDVREHLPLYLCRIVAWTMPLAIWYRSRYWLGIFYFWVLAGTLQANFTPDLSEGFPNFYYFRYWFLHAGLVVTALYAVLVFRIRVTWRDLVRALLWAQLYLIGIHLINLLLDSNYSYTVEKPPGPSILDLFGPWPWYILGGEALMAVLFVLLLVPFLVGRKRSGPAASG